MECNATFIDRSRRRAGATLVELMIALGITGVVGFMLAKLTFYTGRSFAALANYAELDRYSRNALDQVTKKIRMADSVIDYATNRLVLSYQGTNTLTYAYSSVNRTLTETINTTSLVLLKGCDALYFAVFQRNAQSGTYDQFPATLTNSAVKLVQVSWTCSRTVLGINVNTESVQSAKVVIRNQ